MKLIHLLTALAICLVCFNCNSNNAASIMSPVREQGLSGSTKSYSHKAWVSDYDDLFTAFEVLSLEKLIQNFEDKTTAEITVLTLDTIACTKENFDAFTLQLARTWGTGKKATNNGILIAICKGYRKVRIHNGTGIEKIMTDAETKEIIEQQMIPEFREGNYYGGTESGIKKIIEVLQPRLKY
jgi:uncharacterized protein